MRAAVLISIMVTLTLSGCVASYRQSTLLEPTAKLVKGKSVIVATPRNGSDGKTEYLTSGKLTALAIQAAFARYSPVAVSNECSELSCMKDKLSTKYDYYVVPEIIRWEDRATEWNGIPDKVEVTISVYEGQAWMKSASSIIYGKSKSLTFGGLPEELLPEPINTYVDSLY
jgi:hypothetical protein